MNLEIEIARGALAAARSALAGKADDLALVDALRDANLEIALGQRHAPLVIDLRRAQRDHAGSTAIGVLERQQDLRVMILAAHVHARSARAGAAEQLGEEIAEIAQSGLGRAAPRELEPRIPTRRGAEVLARMMAASQLVVRRALLRVREHGIRLVDLLHPRLGIGLLRDVRMVFAREP